MIAILSISIATLAYLEVLSQKRLDIFSSQSATVEAYDVVLDAGHGGEDKGVYVGSIYEKDVTLALVKAIGVELEEQGYRVFYTRKEDITMDKTKPLLDDEQRLKLAKESKAKLFVSLHTSETTNAKQFGFEIWGKIKQTDTFSFARNVMAGMQASALTQSRGIKDQDIAPLPILQDHVMTAIVIYCGNLVHPQDRLLLTSQDTLETYAVSIAQGIMKTLRSGV